MAAGANSDQYIAHHLTNLCVGDCDPVTHQAAGFWALHLDTLFFSVLLGGLFCFFLLKAARNATVGVPSKWLCFAEMFVEFVDNSVKEIFGTKRRDVTGIALTIFGVVLLWNLMDLVPVDFLPSAVGVMGVDYLKVVPTADVNATLALAMISVGIGYYKGIKKNGLHFFTGMLTHPFGGYLFFINLPLRLVEDAAKVVSLSLRLFGNLFAGELIFLLIATLPWFVQFIPGGAWAIFHILVVPLQAYLFMMLTMVYINMFEEH